MPAIRSVKDIIMLGRKVSISDLVSLIIAPNPGKSGRVIGNCNKSLSMFVIYWGRPGKSMTFGVVCRFFGYKVGTKKSVAGMKHDAAAIVLATGVAVRHSAVVIVLAFLAG